MILERRRLAVTRRARTKRQHGLRRAFKVDEKSIVPDTERHSLAPDVHWFHERQKEPVNNMALLDADAKVARLPHGDRLAIDKNVSEVIRAFEQRERLGLERRGVACIKRT